MRARLGSLVSHSTSIQVWSDNGRITLSGGVVAGELARLMRGVSSIRGVTGVENLLTVQESSESLAGHYGRARRRTRGIGVQALRNPWPSVTRLLVGASGGILALGGAVRRNINGGTIALLGIAMLTGALSTIRFLSGADAPDLSAVTENGAPHHNGARNGEGAW